MNQINKHEPKTNIVINMSYGEPSSLPQGGRFPELLNELITKDGIVFVSSAGNNGPW